MRRPMLYKTMIAQTVEVFKTNVRKVSDASLIMAQLSDLYPAYQFNFNLEDPNYTLCVEGFEPNVGVIQCHLRSLGFNCRIMS